MNQREAKARRAERVEKRREAERLCALDFLTWGDTQGFHFKRCVHAGTSTPVCSLEYDPGPAPEDTRLYEGTQLGALWGLSPTSESTVALLTATRAGWDIKRRGTE